ncbi:MAG: 4-hydroxy-2-oxovalerate aldolase [Candidatus Roizmanbacteria bacterium]|nr:4-hydroxy-2-oxovalerate aldolase [Candidatus Roizmanbacteria bacterium]
MNVTIQDSTLRDGNHAIRHQLGPDDIAGYCQAADLAGIPILEVGHGNGLGASSFQVGIARLTDEQMLRVARENLKKTKLAVHIMPGFATIERDLRPALALGVDVVRVGTHCTEADISERHIQFAAATGVEVIGALMMSHMADKHQLLEEAKKFQDYGALGISLYDSAGSYLPTDVKEKVSHLVDNLKIRVGFHAHNNLGMAIANSVAAVEVGASIIDASIKGFGAGAGNAQLEVLVAVFGKLGIDTGIDLYKVLDCADFADGSIVKVAPIIKPTSIVSGLAGVFSGFSKHVDRIAEQYGVDPRDVFFELGRRNVVGGQEDLIIEVASSLRGKGRGRNC